MEINPIKLNGNFFLRDINIQFLSGWKHRPRSITIKSEGLYISFPDSWLVFLALSFTSLDWDG